ncbi:MAG: IS110 family transposase [Isosphaeraceae bacterium]
MSKVTVFVGLDYHEDSVQVCVMDCSRTVLANRSCRDAAAAIAQVVASLGHHVRAAIEARSGAAALADELINRHGWDLDMAHPGYVNRMRRSPDKSDYSDAKILADLVRVGYLPKVWLAPEDARQLRTLVRYRQQLVDQRRAVKLRVTALLREARLAGPGLRRWGRPWMRWLETAEGLGSEARFVMDRHLADLRSLDQRMVEVVAQLVALRGLGRVTAWALRAEIGRFDRFGSGKQLARYCGLSPRNASSGQRQADAGLIKAGNELSRATLIEAAHRLIRFDDRWRALATTLRVAGKPACVVAAAVANRWTRWLFHQVSGGPITLRRAS